MSAIIHKNPWHKMSKSKWTKWYESNDELGGILLVRYYGKWALRVRWDDFNAHCTLLYDEDRKNIQTNHPYSCYFIGGTFHTRSVRTAKARGMEFVKNCFRHVEEMWD